MRQQDQHGQVQRRYVPASGEWRWVVSGLLEDPSRVGVGIGGGGKALASPQSIDNGVLTGERRAGGEAMPGRSTERR